MKELQRAILYAQLLQQCPSFCNPMDPARLLCTQDFPGMNTEVGCQSLLPNPGFEPGSPVLQADSLLTDTTLVIHSKSNCNSTLIMFPLATNQYYSHNNKSPTATWHYIKQDTQIPSSASYSHKTKKGKKGI